MMAVQPHVVIGLGESGRSVARRTWRPKTSPSSVGEDHPAAAAMHRDGATSRIRQAFVPISELFQCSPGSTMDRQSRCAFVPAAISARRH